MRSHTEYRRYVLSETFKRWCFTKLSVRNRNIFSTFVTLSSQFSIIRCWKLTIHVHNMISVLISTEVHQENSFKTCHQYFGFLGVFYEYGTPYEGIIEIILNWMITQVNYTKIVSQNSVLLTYGIHCSLDTTIKVTKQYLTGLVLCLELLTIPFINTSSHSFTRIVL